MTTKLISMMDRRIGSMSTYAEQADFIEAVHDTLSAIGQLTEEAEKVINEQWDKINKEFMGRSVNGRALLTAV